MKNLKQFENYTDKKCEANLTVLHFRNGEYRLLIELTSASGVVFNPDGVQLRESDAKKLINEFGAKVEER